MNLYLFFQGFPSENKTGQVQFCRDSWIQNLTVAEFKVLTCSKCHIQVLLGRAVLTFPDTPWPPAPPYALVHQYTNRTYLPDPDRYPSAVCEAALLDKADCERWRSCCQAARRCCEMMGSEEEAVSKYHPLLPLPQTHLRICTSWYIYTLKGTQAHPVKHKT